MNKKKKLNLSSFLLLIGIFEFATAIASELEINSNTASTTQTTSAPSSSSPGFKPRWIHGSLVNVRAKPAEHATVIAQLKVNTPLQATSNASSAAIRDSFCEIIWGENQHGFVLCQLLGDKVLTLGDVGSQYLPDGRSPNPNYSATRAFWIEPSLERLLESGRYFESKFLSNEEQTRERGMVEFGNARPKPRRFSIPEFEAMKAVMRNGIIGAISNPEPRRLISQSPTLASWNAIKATVKDASPSDKFSRYNELRSLHPFWGLRDPSVALLQKLELPNVKASLFQNENEIGRPLEETEKISAKFSIPYQAIVKSGPQWLPDGHQDPGYVWGAWDVGAIETRLTREVHKHTIYASGKIVSESTVVKGGKYPPDNADGEECNLGYSLGDASPKAWKALASSASWVRAPRQNSDAKLFYFYTKVPLQYALAKVKSQRKEFYADGFVSATSSHFDIDSDGVMDILVWEGTGRSKQDIHDPNTDLPHYRMVFINIKAGWHLLAVDEFLYGCGC